MCLNFSASSGRVWSLAYGRFRFLTLKLIHAVFWLEIRFESLNLSGRSFGGHSFSGGDHLFNFILNELSLGPLLH